MASERGRGQTGSRKISGVWTGINCKGPVENHFEGGCSLCSPVLHADDFPDVCDGIGQRVRCGGFRGLWRGRQGGHFCDHAGLCAGFRSVHHGGAEYRRKADRSRKIRGLLVRWSLPDLRDRDLRPGAALCTPHHRHIQRGSGCDSSGCALHPDHVLCLAGPLYAGRISVHGQRRRFFHAGLYMLHRRRAHCPNPPGLAVFLGTWDGADGCTAGLHDRTIRCGIGLPDLFLLRRMAEPEPSELNRVLL